MGVQYIDLGYNATGTVQTIRVGKDISLFAQGGEPPVPVVDPPTIALSTSSISATDTFVLATIVSEVAWELTGTGISTITGESSDIVTITVGENTGSTSREFTFVVTNSAGSDTTTLTQAAPVIRDIHATYNFVANTPTKVYDEYGVTAVTNATYTIDDGTEAYTGSTLEFATDGEHTLHFVSEDNHTWSRMFSGCTELTSLVLDSSVTRTYGSTCRNCSALTDVSMPGVQTIDASSFQACTSLTGFTFPAAVTIGNLAFTYTKPTSTITIPKTTTSIGASAFSYTNLVIYDALVFESGRTQTLTIGNYAFRGSRMRKIECAPEIDFSSGTNIFRECIQLTGVTGYNVPTDHPHESNTRAIRGGCFQACTNLESFNPGWAQVTVPEGIEKVGPSAFSGCSSIGTVDLPASLNNSIYKATLDVKAPFANTNVQVIISRSAVEPPVSGTSFTGMSATGRLYTPTGADYSTWLSYLGPGWTQYSIDDLPPDVEATYVGDTVNILTPEGVQLIERMVVDGVTYEPSEYFTFTGTSRTIKYYGVPRSGQLFVNDSVVNLKITRNLEGFNYAPALTGLTVFMPGQTVGSFGHCTALTEVNFEAVKQFYAGAFRGCVGLTSIHIPEGCTTTRQNTFSDCTGVTSLYIPSTLSFISSTSGSFANLTSLTSLTVNKITAPTTGYFTGAPTGTLYVPEGATGYDAWLTELGEGWSLSYITS